MPSKRHRRQSTVRGYPIMTGERSTPNLILTRGLFTTLDRSRPTANAVAIKDGKFLAVGRDEDVMPLAGVETTVIDLEGRRARCLV
jgi:predicted amidohydrolase YtcJ